MDTELPVIRMFGVTANGHSVAAHVHNFTAYFYIAVTEKGVDFSEENIEAFRKRLN